MPARRSQRPVLSVVVLVLVATWLAACANRQQEPARAAIAAIEAELAAAGTAPAKYIPGELEDTQTRLDTLKQQYAAQQFDAVVEAAPEVLAAARQLAPTAAARAKELEQALQTEWTSLSAALPGELATMQAAVTRVAALRALPTGLDTGKLQVARQRATDAQALWDRAQVEQGAGRLPEAVTLANQARDLARQILALPGFGAGSAAVE
ncbi:MAG TPA: hypothetical protein VNS57_06760 [Steroidobacteraceae bacterium]|nr:hypothetical protein [Steroidobacteraceae bacterium]